MIVVRNSFTAKPGQASKLAAQLKEVATAGKLRNHRILTDLTGDFNQVVMEHEVETAAEFEELFKRYVTDPQLREKAKGYTELWRTGRRELFQLL
jgi:triphosphoribosyl-dephospho-CoA synthetase